MERAARQRLMARPAWPPPTITAAVLRAWPLADDTMARRDGSIHHDRDIRRIGHDVIDRRALLRLRHQRLDLLALGVGVDLVGDLDAVKAVAHLAVYAEDALEIHVAF